MNLGAIGGRLRELEKKGKLEKLLAKADEGMPWGDILWVFGAFGVVGIVVHVVRVGLAAADAGVRPPDMELVWLLLLMLVTAALFVVRLFVRSPAGALRRKVRRHGLVVPAVIVQANDAFYDDGNDQWVPASVLLSFDPAVMDKPELLARLARRVAALKRMDRRLLPADQALLAWDLYHELVPLPSRAVPGDLTEGLRDCIVATVMLPPKPLRDDSLCVCLAVPGSTSCHAVAVIPAEAVA